MSEGRLPTRSQLAAQLDVEIQGWETISPTQRAYLAALIETAGNQGRAADAAGVNRSTPWKWENGAKVHGTEYKPNPAYLEALQLAKDVAANVLEDEARRRGMEGVRRYEFHQGRPVQHPDRCECRHDLREHARPRKPDHVPEGEEVDQTVRPCVSCSCEDFLGAPYYEHEYSDKLLALLLGAKKPKEYATRRIEHTRQIDWDRLPDHLVARIARGEDVNAVLASAADEGERYLLKSGAELGGPRSGSDGTAGELIERDEGEEEGDSAGEDAPRWLDL